MQNKDLIAKLHKIGAVKYGEFKLKSGAMSPVYIDLRILVSYPKILQHIAELLWQKVQTHQFDLICGVPYTALPIATCMSIAHDKPMVMRRKESKNYGTKQMIEGHYQAGQSCLVVEDVITSGASVLETTVDLENAGLKIAHVVVLVDREQGGKENLKQKGYNVSSILTLEEIIASGKKLT
jgi:orotate phosphoribosyltransferase